MSDFRLAVFICFLFLLGFMILAAPAKLSAGFALAWHVTGADLTYAWHSIAGR
jgi:hypothetical protein